MRLFVASYGGSPVDVMSSSIELLRFENLIEIRETAEDTGDSVVALTGDGEVELGRLLRAPVGTAGAYARLHMALKMRFLHLLTDDERALQRELLAEALEGELARLLDLRRRMVGEHPDFLAWLDRDIDRADADLRRFEDMTVGMDIDAENDRPPGEPGARRRALSDEDRARLDTGPVDGESS